MLPHLIALEQQYDEREALLSLAGKEAAPYDAAIRKLEEQINKPDEETDQERQKISQFKKSLRKQPVISLRRREKEK
ncbi:MAG: hypothetical protein ACLTQG_30585 [Hungatella sp.]|uniref:hypothetical protein n=1 Tax=Hungatella sp. TaxID=2613924 RepID=UPI003995D7BF